MRGLHSQVGFSISMPVRLLALTTLEGDVSIHLVPAIQIGINVLNGAVIDAQVWAVGNIYWKPPNAT